MRTKKQGSAQDLLGANKHALKVRDAELGEGGNEILYALRRRHKVLARSNEAGSHRHGETHRCHHVLHWVFEHLNRQEEGDGGNEWLRNADNELRMGLHHRSPPRSMPVTAIFSLRQEYIFHLNIMSSFVFGNALGCWISGSGKRTPT